MVLQVIPIFQCFIVFSNALAGIVYFHDMRNAATYKLALFGAGGGICMSGVAILLFKRKSQVHTASEADKATGSKVDRAASLLSAADAGAGDDSSINAAPVMGGPSFTSPLRSPSSPGFVAPGAAAAAGKEEEELMTTAGFQAHSAAVVGSGAAAAHAGDFHDAAPLPLAWWHREVKDVLAAAWAGASARASTGHSAYLAFGDGGGEEGGGGGAKSTASK